MNSKKITALALAVVLGASIANAGVVSDIRVTGLSSVPLGMVKSVIKCAPGNDLDLDVVQQDISRIFGLGYFSHVDAKGEMLADGSLCIVYLLEEHPVISDVKFEGLSMYNEKVLARLLHMKPGKLFNQLVSRLDMEALAKQFREDGLGVTLRGMRLAEDNTLIIMCHEPLVREVRIEGNRRVKEHVIRRYVRLKPGQPFRKKSLEYISASLKATGLFSEVHSVAIPLENGDMDVVVRLVEGKTAAITLNAGWGSDTGGSGGLAFSENNVGGNGQKFDIGFSVSEEDERICWATWSDPYQDKKSYSWAAGLYMHEYNDLTYRYGTSAGRYDVFDYRETQKGGWVSLGKWLDRSGRWFWKLTADRHDSWVGWQASPVGGFTVAETKAWFDAIAGDGSLDSEVFSLRGEITHNGLDRRVVYPTGWKQTVGIEQAFAIFGGHCDFTKYWAEARGYMPLKWFRKWRLGFDEAPVTLATRLMAGWSSGTIPLAERYSLGGNTSIRGFDSGDFKGHEMLLGNFELRVPVLKNCSLAAFYDTGNAWDTSVGSMSFSDLYDSYGAGARFVTAMGLVRVDVAWGGDETKWSLGLGEIF